MPLGQCMEHAVNMTIPHWGLPSWLTNDTSPSMAHNVSNQGELSTWSSYRTDRSIFQYENGTFPGNCGAWATTVPFRNETAPVPTAIVINITTITNANPDRIVTIRMSSCDGSVAVNTTKAGVFVIKGSEMAVMVERWYGPNASKSDSCSGESFFAFTSAALEDVCKTDAALAECKKNDTVPPGTSSSTTTAKQSVLLSVISVFWAALVVAMT